MVYPTWNSFPISVLTRPSVQRWSLANPCASGPLRSSASSRAHCCGLSRSRDTGPFDRSAPAPPSRHARCHRRTDPSVTRRSRAISPIASPRANRLAASSRSRSRRSCSAGVYPPRCAYLIPRSYARDHPASRPPAAGLYEFKRVSVMPGQGRGRSRQPHLPVPRRPGPHPADSTATLRGLAICRSLGPLDDPWLVPFPRPRIAWGP